MADKLIEALEALGATLTLKIGDREETFRMEARRFATGGGGFFCQGKVTDSEGRKYQVTVPMSVVGSSPKAAKPIAEYQPPAGWDKQ